MEEEKLSPCKVCGGSQKIEPWDSGPDFVKPTWKVSCPSCGMSTGWESANVVVSMWEGAKIGDASRFMPAPKCTLVIDIRL